VTLSETCWRLGTLLGRKRVIDVELEEPTKLHENGQNLETVGSNWKGMSGGVWG